MNAGSLTMAIQTALNCDPRSDKELARAVDAVPRTIRAWRDGTNLPGLPHFIKLCLAIPELRAAALDWLAADCRTDPQSERLTMEILQLATRHIARQQREIEEEGPP